MEYSLHKQLLLASHTAIPSAAWHSSHAPPSLCTTGMCQGWERKRTSSSAQSPGKVWLRVAAHAEDVVKPPVHSYFSRRERPGSGLKMSLITPYHSVALSWCYLLISLFGIVNFFSCRFWLVVNFFFSFLLLLATAFCITQRVGDIPT